MKLLTKVRIVTLVVAIPALALGRVIWPDAPGLEMPSAIQLPFFIFLQAVEALLFGLGVAFVIFAWPKIRSIVDPKQKRTLIWVYGALSWLMLNWWPHDNMHRWNGENIQGLLYIDYGFHLTIVVATVIVVKFFISYLK